MSHDRYTTGVMHQPDCLVQGEKAFGNVAGDEVALEGVFNAAGISLGDQCSRQVGAANGIPGSSLNLVKIQDSPPVSPETFVDPVQYPPVSLQTERTKEYELFLETDGVMIDAVTEKVDVLERVPHTGEFDSRENLHPVLRPSGHCFVDTCDTVMIAESNGVEADVARHGDECRR